MTKNRIIINEQECYKACNKNLSTYRAGEIFSIFGSKKHGTCFLRSGDRYIDVFTLAEHIERLLENDKEN